MIDDLPPLPEPARTETALQNTRDRHRVVWYSAHQMQAYARAAIEKDRERQSVPADCDARKIMLAVVPSEDGMGHEVYANNISEVEAKLSEMGDRLEKWELGIWSLAAAPQPLDCLHINKGSADEAAIAYEAEYWAERAQGKADADTRRGAVQRVGYYVRDAILRMQAQAPQPQPVQQEPVAEVKARADSIGGTFIQRYAELAPGTKLYTSPQAAQPLSDDRIAEFPVWRHFVGLTPEHRIEITRAIEQAHGITKGTT